ncbi:MAG: chemotaxis-specific protein-glutamate methyltransferase CheB [Candidatus Rokubacteria bacterium]|nr:chemotaxis-specific protein-glutamate methyltransferase CheB [Candidatus Rokubacteria bacterium]
MSARRIRVLVVEDSRFMRGVISQILGADPQIDVVGCASDGIEAVEAVATLAPDVVTMDVDMPRADGLSAVETIMAQFPTPILMISAFTRPNSAAALRALELGAVDFVAKPSFTVDIGLEALRGEILKKVRMAARVRPVRTAKRAAARPDASRDVASVRALGEDWRPCVAIAASTGGPAALLTTVPELPRDLAASVIVLQHMPAPYTGQLARELAARSAVAVKEAEDGERLRRGVVYVCPGAHHLAVTAAGRVMLRRAPANLGEAPSADLALTSVAQHAPAQALGVILTGMGRDGAAGAQAIRRSGGIVMAQDEASCVVYGMPQAALEQGGVDAVVPLNGLVPALLAFVDDLAGIAMRTRGVS